MILPEVDLKILTWELNPIAEETPFAYWHIWWTICRRYRVVRRMSKSIEYPSDFVAEVKIFPGDGKKFPARMQDLYVHGRLLGSFQTLDRAIEACQNFKNLPSVNRTDLMVSAKKMGLINLNSPTSAIVEVEKKRDGCSVAKTDRPSTKVESRIMAKKPATADALEIVRPDAVALLEDLGVKTAKSYTNEKLAAAIVKIVKKRDEDEEALDSDESQALLEEVMEHMEEDGEIEVTGDEEDEDEESNDDDDSEEEEEEDDEDEKPSKKKSKKKAPPAKSKKKAKDEDEDEEEEEDEDEDEDEKPSKKKSKAGRSSKEGGRRDQILEVLGKSKKGLDVHQIAEKLGIKDTPNTLPFKILRELLGTKKIVKGEDGVYKAK